MTRFCVGDHVTIRYGKHQGKKATIMTSHPVDSYKVKIEDGFVLFFSSKGLVREPSHERLATVHLTAAAE